MHKLNIFIGFLTLFSGAFLLSTFGKTNLSGETKSEPLIRISSPDADSAEPSLASAPGGVYLVWVEHRQDGAADVFLQKFDSAKNPVGEKVRVNPQIGKATAWRGDPPTVKVGGDNTIYVGWTARVETDEGTANDLYLSVSHNGGQTFDPPVKVNDDKIPAVHGMHSLAIDKNDNVYFSWLDDRYLKYEAQKRQTETEKKPEDEATQPHHMESNREVYFAVSKNGGKSFEANKRLAGDACPCCKVSMITASDGKIYVSWRQVLPGNYRHIALASSDNRGKTFTPTVIVSDDKWQLEGCPVSGATLAVGGADNSLKIIWYSAGDAGKTGLYWTESKDGGKTFSPRSLIYEGVLTGTPLILANTNKDYKIVWQSNGKVWQLNTQLTTDYNNKIEEIGTGKMPAAAIAGEKLFVGFIQSEGDKRSIWLY